MGSSLFFCAIGGSGMLPLAMIAKARGVATGGTATGGADVRGSDRSFDQGRTPERFAFIEAQGIKLFPQDGSGVTAEVGQVIVSSAVEETVPDYQAALRQNIPVRKRADLLAEMFNGAKTSIALAGTSGKSTTTGMAGWILQACGKKPTIVNGAIMKNFVTEAAPFASAAVGDPDLFVAEVDESDGSIALFNPTIAVLNNIALDHKSMAELRALFRDFIGKAQSVVLNLDNAEVARLAKEMALPHNTLRHPHNTLPHPNAPHRHPRESGDPEDSEASPSGQVQSGKSDWIPAFAGMTQGGTGGKNLITYKIAMRAGEEGSLSSKSQKPNGTPAYAGVTDEGAQIPNGTPAFAGVTDGKAQEPNGTPAFAGVTDEGAQIPNGTPAFAGVTERESRVTEGEAAETEQTATLLASHIGFRPEGVTFDVRFAPTGEIATVRLNLPGAHNVSNALGAIGAAVAAGVPFAEAAKALESFTGIARRLDVIGTAGGVTVIDDFAHNPDKITASLACLRQFEGRLLILFQPHGYGPLRLMHRELAACFAEHLGPEDVLYICDALYLGGTTDKSITSADLAKGIGAKAHHIPAREACAEAILAEARSGDRIVIMGARDDTLPVLARGMVERLDQKA